MSILTSRARHGAMTIETARRASLEFVCVFGQDGHGEHLQTADPLGVRIF